MRRHRHAKIIATLGPASSTREVIEGLFCAGADVFRLNLSHGTHDEHRQRIEFIRSIEAKTGRPIGIMLDLQGPKLRVGTFREGHVTLDSGQGFRLDLDKAPGDRTRASLPHPEIFRALRPGATLLLDDGRLRLRVARHGEDYAETEVVTGGELSDRKGVNLPDLDVPVAPLTAKDQQDLEFGLDMGVDWVAPSFVQTFQDLRELREIVGKRAAILAKLEKPAALRQLDDIIGLSDGVMVARGDLGVEMHPEQVPSTQKRIIRACRQAGKPVVVATQMLESMMWAPIPTRAEASDVAGAVYDGVDAVMLSGETASGSYPVEAVGMMERIIRDVEADPYYRDLTDAQHPGPQPTTADAICEAMRAAAQTLPIAATVTFTSSGFTSLRAARERPKVPILCITPHVETARRLSLVWGVHCVQSEDISQVSQMINDACRTALHEGFAKAGEPLCVVAGMPFGTPGTTNLLHIAWVQDSKTPSR